MAKLADETLTTIFALQRQLAEGIEEASATEWALFNRYGETEATLAELDELLSARERITVLYSRLHKTLLRIVEIQPVAPASMLNLLYQTIEQAEAAGEASSASVREVKRNWNLLL